MSSSAAKNEFDGKVVLITGGARGQGRAIALAFAERGADIVLCDVCEDVPETPVSAATYDELVETAKNVEALGRQCLFEKTDVRDGAAMRALAARAVSELGRIDVLCANAGICSFSPTWEMPDEMWHDVIETNLTGVWQSCKAIIPHLISQGEGGSIIMTSSTAAERGVPNIGHYCASKHGALGLMRTLAMELAPHRIRVNAVLPTSVDTAMISSPRVVELFSGGDTTATREDVEHIFASMHPMGGPWIDAEDVGAAVVWLASEQARSITGVTLPVDLGYLLR